jgi:hypothetical protein
MTMSFPFQERQAESLCFTVVGQKKPARANRGLRSIAASLDSMPALIPKCRPATMGVGAWRTKRNLGNALSCEIWSNPLGAISMKFVRLTLKQSETAK